MSPTQQRGADIFLSLERVSGTNLVPCGPREAHQRANTFAWYSCRVVGSTVSSFFSARLIVGDRSEKRIYSWMMRCWERQPFPPAQARNLLR